MTQRQSAEVVIVGGGIVGCATAYYLGKRGVRSVIVERDAVAAHPSGFALGGLNPLGGAGIPDPLGPLSMASFWLHKELAWTLSEETGIDTEYEPHMGITVAYTEEEAKAIHARLLWQQAQEGFSVEWKSGEDILAIVPRLAPGMVGGVVTRDVGLLDPYKLTLALLQGAERVGSSMRHGTVGGLRFDRGRVVGVEIESEVIPCSAVVLAMGAWTARAGTWAGVDIPTEPLRGQIIRLKASGPPLPYVSWGHNYAVSKPDGLIWVGTTEERAGFDETPTTEARQSVMRAAVKAIPYLIDAEMVRQTACLRPVTPDGLPILGVIPGTEGVVVATGGGRKGIHFGPLMGKIAAQFAVGDPVHHDISPLAPGRDMAREETTASRANPFRF